MYIYAYTYTYIYNIYVYIPLYMYIFHLRATMQQNLWRKYGARAAQGFVERLTNVRIVWKRLSEPDNVGSASVSRMSRCRWNRVTITRRGVLFRNSNRRVSNPSSGQPPGANDNSRANNPFRPRSIVAPGRLPCFVSGAAALYNVVYFGAHSDASEPPQITEIRIYEPPAICKSCTLFFTLPAETFFSHTSYEK